MKAEENTNRVVKANIETKSMLGHNQGFLRKRKMLIVLPILVLPFLTLAFWALGGGKASATNDRKGTFQGLNLQLPSSQIKEDKQENKLTFYNKADKDSSKLAEEMRNDPYLNSKDRFLTSQQDSNALQQIAVRSAKEFRQDRLINDNNLMSTPAGLGVTEPAEQKVMKKLAQINNAISEANLNVNRNEAPMVHTSKESEMARADIDKLQTMMQNLGEKNDTDPEMEQLNNMMDKILDIQHPERINDRIKEKSIKKGTRVYSLSREQKNNIFSLIDTGKNKIQPNSFYGIESKKEDSTEENGIEAVIQENQVLVNGSTIKLRLGDDVYINGVLIPRGNLIYGNVALNDERLMIEINSIRYGNSLFPVKLEVFDMDGLAGIYIPGAIGRDVAKQSTTNTLQLMELSSMDPSLKAQAASAGINAAKNLFSKKVKLIKVSVKSGYKVLLKDKDME